MIRFSLSYCEGGGAFRHSQLHRNSLAFVSRNGVRYPNEACVTGNAKPANATNVGGCPHFSAEWYPHGMYIRGDPLYTHHVDTYGPEFGYKVHSQS